MTMRQGDWSVVRSGVIPAAVPPVELVQANFRMEGNWKYVLEGPADTPGLRLDILHTEDLRSKLPPEPAGDPVILTPGQAWLEETAKRLEGHGYKSHARADKLVVPMGGWQVDVCPEPDGSALCCATFAIAEHASCREATALFLLRAGGCVRMARGVFTTSANAPQAGFMVRIAPVNGEDHAGHALAALEACSLYFVKTIPVLQNELAAVAYLALRAKSIYQTREGELQPC